MPGIATKTFAMCLIVPALASLAPAALAGQPVESDPLARTTTPVQASAQRTCIPHDNADAKLRNEFSEKILGRGISGDGTLLEIFLSSRGSFTVIKTTPDGLSCVVDFGEGWQTLNQLEQVGYTPEDLKVEPAPF
jgi:hypothetical protein